MSSVLLSTAIATRNRAGLSPRMGCPALKQAHMREASRARAVSCFDAAHNVGRILTRMRGEVAA